MIDIRVYRNGALVHQEQCDTEVDAAEVVDDWCDDDEVVCEVEHR